ncbi:extracellular solute-binding protein [Anabaena sp. PCC 7108]|uniref:extracellular solute-binding protein n=1 Tax=Anabaena sp. PCC 7108 TaxID=163908 RepID=UPI0003691295|nr:extracellular solute-binding protein [Anabaena sp. PCC 7108]
MDRRTFLLGTSGLAFSQLLIGCAGKNQIQLNVQLLKGSIPGQVVNKFRKGIKSEVKLKFSPINQIKNLFQQLQTWQQPKAKNQEGLTRFLSLIPSQKAPKADLVTLGDYWLKAAIEQKLIQPIETEQIKEWSGLDEKWQKVVRRDDQGNLNPQGQVWGAPYRWGSTVIVYNRDKFKEFDWQPQDWQDLWRSELRSRISLLNQPREVIGLVLKKLGKSYNTENLDQIPALKTELQALNQQVRFYDSTNYLEPLITGDTWLAVGWSSDIIPILNRYPKLAVVIPQSGTAIWADLWVSPAGVEKKALTSEWIDFCWQPNIAKQIAILTKTNSPMATNISNAELQEPFSHILLKNQEILKKSEFLLPLPSATIKQYESLFMKMKNLG